jgi:hypothetical protein
VKAGLPENLWKAFVTGKILISGTLIRTYVLFEMGIASALFSD